MRFKKTGSLIISSLLAMSLLVPLSSGTSFFVAPGTQIAEAKTITGSATIKHKTKTFYVEKTYKKGQTVKFADGTKLKVQRGTVTVSTKVSFSSSRIYGSTDGSIKWTPTNVKTKNMGISSTSKNFKGTIKRK